MGEAVLSPLAAVVPGVPAAARPSDRAQRAARRTLRRQIARLESELGEAVLASFAMRGHAEGSRPPAAARVGQAHVLGLGELELVRDELADRLRTVTRANRALAARQAAKRAELEQMLLAPGRHRFRRITCEELGEPGCGAWQVRPRLGLLGMLAGWWEVKLSSGCPLGPATKLLTGCGTRLAAPERTRENRRCSASTHLPRALSHAHPPSTTSPPSPSHAPT